MPACPNCHVEYRDGFETCSDCGAALVSDAPGGSQSRPREKQRRLQTPDALDRYSCDKLLANIYDRVELAYIKSALDDLGIPYRALAKDVSQFLYIMHGRSFKGIDIYVPDDSFTPACEALASYRAEPLPEEGFEFSADPVSACGNTSALWFLRTYLFLNFVSSLIGAVFLIGF